MEDIDEVFDVQDVLDVGYTLEPLVCRYCGSLEVTFYQYVGDTHCAKCGAWQLGPESRRVEHELSD